jgi:hypothetical protein
MNEDSVPPGRFLAHVEFLKPDQVNRFARLRPIYKVNEQGWRPVEDAEAQFVDEGLVFWWNPMPFVSEGSLWVITLQPQLGYGSDYRHKDKFAVADAWRPYQAITLQDVAGPVAFRRTLASGQFSVGMPIVGRPLIKIPDEDERWITLPESFRTSTHKDHVLITVSGLEGVTPVYVLHRADFEQVRLGQNQYSLLLDPGASTDFQCALSDSQLIEHMRKRISSVDRAVLDSLAVTKQILRNYVGIIESVELGGDDAAKESARRNAVTDLVKHFDSEVAHLDRLVEALVDYPSIKEGLEARAAQQLQQLREAKERELSEEFEVAIERLSEKRLETEIAARELDELRSSISTAVDDIIHSPLESLTRHGLLDAMRRSLHVGLAPMHRDRKATSPNIEINTITDVASLKQAVVAWCYSTGVDPYVMQISLAAILAHRITLIAGAHSERLAIALASTVAGGSAVRVSVSAAVFGVADLMNSPVSPVGATRLERNFTLGEFLAGRAPDEPMVVILSGCNRAPPEVVLPEFLLPVGGGANTICWSDTGTRIASVALSPGLKVVGTLYAGDATYRLPAELSRQVAFVPSNHQEIGGIQLPAQPAPAPSQIDQCLWDGLQMPSDGDDLGTFVGWLRAKGVGLPPDILTRVLTIYLHLTASPQAAMAEAIAAVLLGRDAVWEIDDIPGTKPEAVFQRLDNLSKSSAWRDAIRYFNLESNQ